MRKTLLSLACAMLFGTAAYAQTSPWSNVSAGAVLPTLQLARQVVAVNAATVWVVYGDPATTAVPSPLIRTVARTNDGGTTWTGGVVNIPAGLSISGLTAVDANTAWISAYGGLASQGIFKTTDGGVTWTKQPSAAFSSTGSFPNGVYFFNANNGVCFGDPISGRYEMYTTTNGGTNWVRNNSAPQAVSTDEYALVYSYYGLGNTIWMGGVSETGVGARLFRSTDMGMTWNGYATNFADQITNIAFSSQSNGLFADGTDLSSTEDGGVTSVSVAYSGNFRGRGMDAIPGGVAGYPEAYVSVGVPADSTSDSNGSSISVDRGQTWSNMNPGTVNINQYAVDMLSSSVGFTGTYTQGTSGAPTVNATGLYKLNRVVTSSKNKAVLAGGLQVFPNPSNDGRFMFNINMVSKQRDLTVTDALGRVVKRLSLQTTGSTVQNQLLDLSQCKAGIYNVRLETEHGTTVEKLVIK